MAIKRKVELTQRELYKLSKEMGDWDDCAFAGTEYPTKREANVIFRVPFVSRPGDASNDAIDDFVEWLNTNKTRYALVATEWADVVSQFKAFLDANYKFHLQYRRSRGRNRLAWAILKLMRIWGAGKLSVLKQCPQCTKIFRASKVSQIFCSADCQVDWNNQKPKSDEFRENRKKYMREYRRNPVVRKRLKGSALSRKSR
jgi:hypothetical protein